MLWIERFAKKANASLDNKIKGGQKRNLIFQHNNCCDKTCSDHNKEMCDKVMKTKFLFC